MGTAGASRCCNTTAACRQGVADHLCQDFFGTSTWVGVVWSAGILCACMAISGIAYAINRAGKGQKPVDDAKRLLQLELAATGGQQNAKTAAACHCLATLYLTEGMFDQARIFFEQVHLCSCHLLIASCSRCDNIRATVPMPTSEHI